MSLDVYLTAVRPTEVYWANITHNLNKMAMEAGIYEALWRPEEVCIKYAHQLVDWLAAGLEKLKSDREYYEQFNAPNGWGMYDDLVTFVERYLEACKENPDAEVRACR